MIQARPSAITSASGSTTSFTIDALGRHGSQTIGSTTSSYAYLGSSDVVVAVTSGSSTTTSAVDGLGDRVASAAGGTFGFLVSDLHGNVAGALDASASSFTDAFAYDAYGDTVASLTSSLPTPWRYQGRMLESGAGAPALYDFAARSYAPSLGIFMSLDTLGGSATNPALLNGYLYADANPATLVDPDGHSARVMYDEDESITEREAIREAPRLTAAQKGDLMPANNNMTDWEQQVRDKANSDVANNKLMRLNENPFFNSVAFHENPHAALADEAAHACAVGGSDMFSRQEGCDIHYGRAQIVDTLDYGTAADNYANLLDGLADLANRYGDKTFDSAVARYSKMDNLLPDYPESLAGDAAGPIRSLGRGLFVVSGGIQVTEDIADLVNGKPLEAVRNTGIVAVSGYVTDTVIAGCAAPAVGADLPVCAAAGVTAGAVTGWVLDWLIPHS